MKFAIYQESRVGKRSNNEDRMAHCYSRDALMMVVADGMGGHYYGEIAAQIAVQTFSQIFRQRAQPKIDDPYLFLQEAMLNAHHAILAFSEKNKLNDSPRTTCVACLIQDNIAYWAHVGDSRLYLIREGEIHFHTRDHTRVQLLLEQGLLSHEEAAKHPDRNKIYSCLGGSQQPNIDFSRKTPLEAGDVISLCSDGFWGVLPPKAMIAGLTSTDLASAIPALLDQAEQRAGNYADNLSVIVVHWSNPYLDAESSVLNISTQSMSAHSFTGKLSEFGRASTRKNELSEEEIERAIEEIRMAIQKHTK
ncbi:MAG: protein phosphatase 2C domain-containing protein [Pseudomonadota bacterium]